MDRTWKTTEAASPSKSNLSSTAVGRLASLTTFDETDVALPISSEQPAAAAADTSTPDNNVMPIKAAAEAIGRFVQTLHCEPQQTAYREIGTAFFAKFSTWYCESKSILKQKADRSLIPKNYDVTFSVQVTDRLKDDQAFKDRIDDMELVASDMSRAIQDFYLEIKSYINADRKLELIEIIASSLPRMAKLILAECGFSQDYGPHNLVADVLTYKQIFLLKFWCDLPYFIELYKRINNCGRAPEEASAMMNRLFPPAAAAQPETDNDSTSQQNSTANNNTALTRRNLYETPSRGIGNNAEDISAISVDSDTPSTNQPRKLNGSGFMTAAQFAEFIANLKPGDNFQAKAAEFCSNIALNTNNDNSNNDAQVPSSIGNSSTAATSVTLPSPSPMRILRNPYTKKVYYSREYTPKEIEQLGMLQKEASRLDRCNSLCLINSIREDNFIEDSFRATTIANGDDGSAIKKLFKSLQPVTMSVDSHSIAIARLYDHFMNVFVYPRNNYLRVYLHNKRVREMKNIEKAFSSELLASDTTLEMVKVSDHDQDDAKPDELLGTFINERVDTSVRKRTAKQETKLLTRMEELEGKLKQAEQVIYNLSTELHQVKGIVPAPAQGNQIIELLDESPMKPPAKKVKLPPQESEIRRDPPHGENPFKKKRGWGKGNRRGNVLAEEFGPATSLNNDYKRPGQHGGPPKGQKKKKRGGKGRQSSTQRP